MNYEAGLPSNVQYEAFCEPRIREIKALDKHLGACEHGQRAFQKLPRNMQRRNVSYNPQRLPRYLREKHKREVGYNIKINKRPSRKYRRRPANLLAEYNRRQKSEIWLETHIWHAKRFHMIRKWGYVLPKTPTFKSYRASIRAATESCLVQDVSYECCLEIEGPISEIIQPFINILPHNDINILKKDVFTDGKISLETFIYQKNRYPFGAVGRATMICSFLSSQNSHHKLWIWVHPSIFENVLNILIELFDFKLIEDEKLSEKDYLIPSGNVVSCVLSSKNTYVKKTPKYLSKLTKLTILKDNLVKYRFTGPESYLLLKRVLIPSNIQSTSAISGEKSCKNNSENYSQENIDSMQETNSQERVDTLPNLPWWVSFYSDPELVKNHESQLSFWNSLNDNDLKSRRVISLIIRDVRAVLPYKKKPLNNLVTSEKGDAFLENCDHNITPLHPIFDAEIRTNVTQNMKSNHEMNKEREKRLIPGGSLPLTEDESRIPVLLMQRPGSHVSNLGSGWDIVLPSGWGSQMLVTLSMNGAVIGGQDEEESIMNEFLTSPPAHHLPDTEAGAIYARKQKEETENEYFRKPPNCRQNYIVLGIKFPFGVDWMELVQHWDSSCNEFYVVRNIDYLRYLSIKSCKKIDKINQKFNGQPLKRKNYEEEEEEHNVKKLLRENGSVSLKSRENYNLSSLIKDLNNSLLYVRLILLGKGCIEPFATICLPTEDDLKNHINDINCTNITERSHEDKAALQRSTLKMEHQKQLNHIRRKRKKVRNDVLSKEENPSEKYPTLMEAVNAAVNVVNEENADMLKKIEEYNKKYNDLWLYDPAKTFQSNSRKIIGFLTQGGFCLRLGRSGGLGYVVTEPLLELMTKYNLIQNNINECKDDLAPSSQIQVLIRNPSTLQYKWARLIILNVC